MEEITVAKRYAEALLGLAVEHRMARRVAQDLSHMEHHFKALPEMRNLLCDPDLPVETRRAYLYRFFPARATRLVKNFYNLLLDQERCHLIEEIYQEYSALWHETAGELQVEVESRFPLTEASRRQLKRSLARFTGEKVEFRERVVKNLVGGVRLRLGDTVIDYTVAGELDRLERHLTG